jgi:hypothetical protein
MSIPNANIEPITWMANVTLRSGVGEFSSARFYCVTELVYEPIMSASECLNDRIATLRG